MNIRRVLLLTGFSLISILLIPAAAADMHMEDRGYDTLDSRETAYDDRYSQDMNQRNPNQEMYYEESYDDSNYRNGYEDTYYSDDLYYRDDGLRDDRPLREERRPRGQVNQPRDTQFEERMRDSQMRDESMFRNGTNTGSTTNNNPDSGSSAENERRRIKPVPEDYSENGMFTENQQENQTSESRGEQQEPQESQDMMQNQTSQEMQNQTQPQLENQTSQQIPSNEIDQGYEGFMVMRPVSGNETGQWQVFSFQIERLQDAFALLFGGSPGSTTITSNQTQ